MTYKELCAEIAALGFETEFDSQERICSAINRALMLIYTERPLYSRISIFKPGITPAARIPDFSHKGGKTDSFSYNARAFSFRTDGIGKYKISEGGREEIFEFSQNSELHRGFLHGEGEINFIGDYSFSVYDFVLFDEIYGGRPQDIPTLSGYTEYQVKDLAEDFMAFVFQPTDDGGKNIDGASVRGGIMRIPDGYCGKVNLIYKKSPKKILGNPDEDIILPDGCEHLLPLLAASFVWLDDDPDKAQYYMSLYREAMSAVKYYDRAHIDNLCHVNNGWA